MTLLLLSTNTGQADYQNEEIRIAIEMVRSAEKKHHLFPVILGDLPKESIPYGLGIRQGIPLSNDTDIESVAGAILEQLDKLKQ